MTFSPWVDESGALIVDAEGRPFWCDACPCPDEDPGQEFGNCGYIFPSTWFLQPGQVITVPSNAGQVSIVVDHLGHFGWGQFNGTYVLTIVRQSLYVFTGQVDSASTGGKFLRVSAGIYPFSNEGPTGVGSGCQLEVFTQVRTVGDPFGSSHNTAFVDTVPGDTFLPDLRVERLVRSNPRSSGSYPGSWTDPRAVRLQALP